MKVARCSVDFVSPRVVRSGPAAEPSDRLSLSGGRRTDGRANSCRARTKASPINCQSAIPATILFNDNRSDGSAVGPDRTTLQLEQRLQHPPHVVGQNFLAFGVGVHAVGEV